MISGKNILITGGTGSFGKTMARKLSEQNPNKIIIYSRDEEKQWRMKQLEGFGNFEYIIGDIRDRDRLTKSMNNVNIVFHAAALKHVPSCEYNPFEAVKTNVLGTQNIIECAFDKNVGKVVNISTDKVTNTINTMGATKLLAERLVTAAQHYRGNKKTIFCTVRFGNVLGSRGSVLQLFEDQIKGEVPVTITNYEMTRFFISIEQAVGLVFKAADIARGGEIFILKMPTIKLRDLAEVAIEEIAPKYGKHHSEIQTRIIGHRPGERLHEELMTPEEAEHALETEELFNVLPNIIIKEDLEFLHKHHSNAKKTTVRNYNSLENQHLTKEGVKALLKDARLI